MMIVLKSEAALHGNVKSGQAACDIFDSTAAVALLTLQSNAGNF